MIIGIIAKSLIASEQKDFIQSLIKRIRKDQHTVIIDENIGNILGTQLNTPGHSREAMVTTSDIVIVLGGDGTLLKVAGCGGKKQLPILGVNFGNTGFLTSIQPEQMKEAWNKILTKNYFIDKRMLLQVQLYRNGKRLNSFLAMNEAVINQGSFARLIELTMDEETEKMISFKADGMIIATPTGSTAHSLSAGGPIVHHALAAMVLTPICPALLSLRPIVIPSNNELTITIVTERQKNQNIGLTIDGQITVPLVYGDQVKIRKSRHAMHLITFNKNGYYKLLREKLGWGKK